MSEKNIRKLLLYLGKIGRVKFRPANFSDPDNPRYARIELFTTEDTARDLEAKINSQLAEETGFKANMRFIALSEPAEGEFKYSAEIVPYDFVPKEEWKAATEDVLRALPKIINNYMMGRRDQQTKNEKTDRFSKKSL